MPIRFTCPKGHRLKVENEKAGHGMFCPVCQEVVTVPDTDATSLTAETEAARIEESADVPPNTESSPQAVGEPAFPPLPHLERSELTPRSVVPASSRHGPPWGIAISLLAVLAFSVLPAAGHLHDTPVPLWVRVVVGIALLQAVFVVWMLVVRHWAAMVVAMVSFILASAAYAIFTWLVLAFAGDFLGESGPASRAAVWCITMATVNMVTAYCCGAAAASWRREGEKEREFIRTERSSGHLEPIPKPLPPPRISARGRPPWQFWDRSLGN